MRLLQIGSPEKLKTYVAHASTKGYVVRQTPPIESWPCRVGELVFPQLGLIELHSVDTTFII